MSLFRAAARTMLASYFIANGIKALKDPKPFVPAAEPLVERVVPLVKQYAPAQVGDKVPEDVATLVRIDGALQVIGGLALATGKGRRLGAAVLAVSLVPATIAKHPFWTRNTLEERSADRAQFLKNISLLGGVLLAARDTEGRPGLAWRAQKTQQSLARDTRRTSKKISKAGHELSDQGRELAEGAIAGGTALIGSVVATGRKARKEAAKELKKDAGIARKQLVEAQKIAASAAADAQKVAVAAAKKAKKDAPKIAKQVKKDAIAAAKQAKKDAPKLAKQAEKARKEAVAAAAAATKQARKDAPKLAKQAEQARKDAVKAARKALDERGKAIKKARKEGGSAIEQVLEDGGKLVEQVKKDAPKIAADVIDQAQAALETAVDTAKDSAAKVSKNIHLGDN